MTVAAQWLAEYARVRAYESTRPSDWISIPLLVASLVALFWSLPVPAIFRESSPVLNWGTLFLMAAVVYYFIVSISLAFGSLPFVIGAAAASAWLDRLQTPLWMIAGSCFLVVAVWQLMSSWRVAGRLHIFGYFQYLMIGPLWLLAAAYRRLGIPY